MTCIAGIQKNNAVYIGGDSMASNFLHTAEIENKKVFKNGDFIFGCTSSFRMLQLLRYKFNPPTQEEEDDVKYMVTTFVDELRETFDDKGFLQEESDGQERGGRFLVGYKGKLYRVDSDFQIGIRKNKYAAVGSGGSYAEGAIYAMIEQGKENPKEIIRTAISAASKHDPYVGGEINIIKQEYDRNEEFEHVREVFDNVSEEDREELVKYLKEKSGFFEGE